MGLFRSYNQPARAIELYLIELENISAITDSSGTLTSITKESGKVFRKYQLVQYTATAEETLVGNLPNGTLYYSQKVTLVINKQHVAMRNEILLLAKNRLAIVTVGNNVTFLRLAQTKAPYLAFYLPDLLALSLD